MNLPIIIKGKEKTIVLIIPGSEEQRLFDIINVINNYHEFINSCNYEFLINKIHDELNISVQFLPVLAEIIL